MRRDGWERPAAAERESPVNPRHPTLVRAAAPLALLLATLACDEASPGDRSAAPAASPASVVRVASAALVRVEGPGAELVVGATAIDPARVADRGLGRLSAHPVTGDPVLTLDAAPGSPAWRRALADAARDLPDASELAPGAAVVLELDRAVDAAAARGVRVHGEDGRPVAARVLPDARDPRRLLVDLDPGEVDALVAGPPRGARWDGGPLVLELGGPLDAGVVSVVPAELAAQSVPATLLPPAPPFLVGEQPITVDAVAPLAGGRFQLAWTFATPGCATLPAPRELVAVGSVVAQVLPGAPVLVGASASGVVVRVLDGNPSALQPGPGRFLSPFLSAAGDVPECFVTFSPAPQVLPAQGVDPAASALVRFNVPMDAATVRAMETFAVLRDGPSTALTERVVGDVVPSPDLRSYRFVPALPLAHAAGSAETYRVQLTAAQGGLRSASGDLPIDLPGDATFALDPAAAASGAAGVVLTLGTLDHDGNGLPEVRGQLLPDPQLARAQARAVTRFSALADAGSLTIGAMSEFGAPVGTPFTPFGAHLQASWRYLDVGFDLLDDANHNLDVEGLAWAPFAGQVLFEQFSGFEMLLSHGSRLPDETLDLGLQPRHPNSGLQLTYAQNTIEAPRVVHPRALGYTVSPADTFVAASGRTMIPWPLNEGLPLDQYQRFTWRDTRLQDVAGTNGSGADPEIVSQLTGMGNPLEGFYAAGQVPTIGLPLLMEFKTFPDDAAIGLNGIQVALALSRSGVPYFRAFSAGGVDTGGQVVLVDPDADPAAQGGFSPGGQPTPGRDNAVLLGQVDFVVRVNVAHTVWIDSGSATTSWAPPALGATDLLQAPGASASLAFRGADAVPIAATNDASQLDPYGDVPFVVFHGGDATWSADPTALDGARYLQARITLVSDPVTGDAALIDSLGVAWTP